MMQIAPIPVLENDRPVSWCPDCVNLFDNQRHRPMRISPCNHLVCRSCWQNNPQACPDPTCIQPAVSASKDAHLIYTLGLTRPVTPPVWRCESCSRRNPNVLFCSCGIKVCVESCAQASRHADHQKFTPRNLLARRQQQIALFSGRTADVDQVAAAENETRMYLSSLQKNTQLKFAEGQNILRKRRMAIESEMELEVLTKKMKATAIGGDFEDTSQKLHNELAQLERVNLDSLFELGPIPQFLDDEFGDPLQDILQQPNIWEEVFHAQESFLKRAEGELQKEQAILDQVQDQSSITNMYKPEFVKDFLRLQFVEGVLVISPSEGAPYRFPLADRLKIVDSAKLVFGPGPITEEFLEGLSFLWLFFPILSKLEIDFSGLSASHIPDFFSRVFWATNQVSDLTLNCSRGHLMPPHYSLLFDNLLPSMTSLKRLSIQAMTTDEVPYLLDRLSNFLPICRGLADLHLDVSETAFSPESVISLMSSLSQLSKSHGAFKAFTFHARSSTLDDQSLEAISDILSQKELECFDCDFSSCRLVSAQGVHSLMDSRRIAFSNLQRLTLGMAEIRMDGNQLEKAFEQVLPHLLSVKILQLDLGGLLISEVFLRILVLLPHKTLEELALNLSSTDIDISQLATIANLLGFPQLKKYVFGLAGVETPDDMLLDCIKAFAEQRKVFSICFMVDRELEPAKVTNCKLVVKKGLRQNAVEVEGSSIFDQLREDIQDPSL